MGKQWCLIDIFLPNILMHVMGMNIDEHFFNTYVLLQYDLPDNRTRTITILTMDFGSIIIIICRYLASSVFKIS